MAYGFGKGLNQKIALFDFGGGTCDVAIFSIKIPGQGMDYFVRVNVSDSSPHIKW